VNSFASDRVSTVRYQLTEVPIACLRRSDVAPNIIVIGSHSLLLLLQNEKEHSRILGQCHRTTTTLQTTMTLPTSGAAPISVGGLVGGSDSMLLGLTFLSVLSLLYAFFVLRPRTKGGSSAPPTVTNSPVSGLPVVGTIVEFGKSPVKMVQRCYEEYGPVFTVPVS
jgi:hypothetical protein